MANKKVLLSMLVEDMELYPRHSVDEVHVASLARALEAGDTLPPIIIDKESLRITDGWHRARAWRRVFGAEAEIEVEERSYANRKEMILDAIRMNSTHGRKLDRTDYVRAAIMAQQAGASSQQIALVLHVTAQEVEHLKLRVATVAASSEDAAPRTTLVPLKRSIAKKFAGKRLTLEQAEAHRSMPGTSLTLLAVQLTKAIELDLLDSEEKGIMDALHALKAALDRFLRQAA